MRFLKLTVQILADDEDVKQSVPLILAMASVKENNYNIGKLVDLTWLPLALDRLERLYRLAITLNCDSKMNHLLCGVNSSAGTHPCVWCIAPFQWCSGKHHVPLRPTEGPARDFNLRNYDDALSRHQTFVQMGNHPGNARHPDVAGQILEPNSLLRTIPCWLNVMMFDSLHFNLNAARVNIKSWV